MKYLLTPGQMMQADNTAINNYGIPGALLMENAAHSFAAIARNIFIGCGRQIKKISVFCGAGNNGGDGFAIARHLFGDFPVEVFWKGSIDKMSPETKTNFLSLQKIGLPLRQLNSEADLQAISIDSDCIIDALIGVGGSENIRGLALPILRKINEAPSLKIAVDAPTGLNTETGEAHEDCFRADYTITMFATKTGMARKKGLEVCGRIFTAGLGAPFSIVENFARNFILENEDIYKLLPNRKKVSSKFDYGRVIIVAGSENFPGAAALAANASVVAGAGLTELFTPAPHASIMPEVILHKPISTGGGDIAGNSAPDILKSMEKANALVIGPGLGASPETIALVKELLLKTPDTLPVVVDADGLKAISKNAKLRKNIILTPHTGELSKIIETGRGQIEENSVETAKEWAKRLNCTILLKHIPVIITDGEKSYWKTNGNPGMSSGGSGDVLSGIIGALAAQGLEPLEAAALGAFTHASAGDIYARRHNQITLTPSSLLITLKEVF